MQEERSLNDVTFSSNAVIYLETKAIFQGESDAGNNQEGCGKSEKPGLIPLW